MVGDDRSHIPIQHARLASSDRFVKTLTSYSNKLSVLLFNVSNKIGGIQISMIAKETDDGQRGNEYHQIPCMDQRAILPAIVQSDIDIDNVTILQRSVVRDTVANNLIDRSGAAQVRRTIDQEQKESRKSSYVQHDLGK